MVDATADAQSNAWRTPVDMRFELPGRPEHLTEVVAIVRHGWPFTRTSCNVAIRRLV